MKTSLTLSFVLASLAVLAVHAQGTFNASNDFVPAGFTTKAFVLAGGCQPVSEAVWRVDIVNPRSESHLSPGGPAGVAFTSDGLFSIHGLSVPGMPTGGSADLVLRVWDSSTGPTYADALVRDETVVTIRNLGGGNIPPATFAADSNFVGMKLYPCPEPSSVALAALGLAGACWGFRRKS
jgi:PEP-CTERM motif